MNTLNYWLGKLQRMQLFGHGVELLVIELDGRHYLVQEVVQENGQVIIKIKE